MRRIRELERDVERGGSVARDSHNSSLPPSLDPPWQKVSRTRSLRKQSGRKPGGQFGHRGTTLRQVTQPDQIITHAPEVCTGCRAPLHHSKPMVMIRRQIFDITNGRVQVTEHRAEARRCSACATMTKAKFPASVRAPVQYGQGVLSRSVYLHLYQLLPAARSAETMRDLFSCRISAATNEQCRHSLCNVHLLRDLVFVEESSPEQKVWTTPLAKLLLKMKETAAEAKAEADARLSERIKNDFLCRYDKLVRKADLMRSYIQSAAIILVCLNLTLTRVYRQPGKRKTAPQPNYLYRVSTRDKQSGKRR